MTAGLRFLGLFGVGLRGNSHKRGNVLHKRTLP